ncbi:hypothetical protein [Sporosarcina sp. 6E9]|uniref:hypothetical protein n=1 Tax=Sporosarcina sp. 6E9 TaxID=2819235 RepID=UPI001B312387|nr:hypothetical protein [Sporosarcina sp. 6E9]
MLNKIYHLFKTSKLLRLSFSAGFGAFSLYTLNKFYLRDLLNWSFGKYYLNDVLAGLLIVGIVNILSIYGNQRRLLLIKLPRILVFTLLCGMFWEYVTPVYLHYSVSDPFDVAAYMFGGLCYWIIIRMNPVNRPNSYN